MRRRDHAVHQRLRPTCARLSLVGVGRVLRFPDGGPASNAPSIGHALFKAFDFAPRAGKCDGDSRRARDQGRRAGQKKSLRKCSRRPSRDEDPGFLHCTSVAGASAKWSDSIWQRPSKRPAALLRCLDRKTMGGRIGEEMTGIGRDTHRQVVCDPGRLHRCVGAAGCGRWPCAEG